MGSLFFSPSDGIAQLHFHLSEFCRYAVESKAFPEVPPAKFIRPHPTLPLPLLVPVCVTPHTPTSEIKHTNNRVPWPPANGLGRSDY